MAVVPKPLFVPALQGSFGSWTYYSALVRIDDVVERVGYATPLQANSRLAEQIQRRLDDRNRAKEIAEYLLYNQERFFNALVVGVLGGQPKWYPFSLSSHVNEHELGEVTERDQDLVGYLQFTGTQTLFALDGQHRLAGIKLALTSDPALAGEKLGLLFVPHLSNPSGIVRTRNLFISLNKKAVSVKRKDIIILDEVDLAAIVTRRLIDDHLEFSCGVVDVDRFGNAIPATSVYWTTIGNFYDTNRIIISDIIEGRSDEELKVADKIRLSEERIRFYLDGVIDFYKRLADLEPWLKVVFSGDADKAGEVVIAARTEISKYPLV
jgi:DNA sulfur modification protein DndB